MINPDLYSNQWSSGSLLYAINGFNTIDLMKHPYIFASFWFILNTKIKKYQLLM